MRLITWNINSVRARLDLLKQLIHLKNPDIICLQETKVEDHSFPKAEIKAMGYEYFSIKGQKTHHGVAILSRIEPVETYHLNWCGKKDARHTAICLEGQVAIHNFYVPAGGDEPDPDKNEKFAHKLNFLDEMIDWAEKLAVPTIMVGDLNIAPYPDDVWSHRSLLKVVSHTEIERLKMAELKAAHNWVDIMREFHPLPQKLYSWWSYRAKDWAASDRGRRLDHIWTSPALASKAKSMEVFKEARGWTKPSDHAPVIVDFDL